MKNLIKGLTFFSMLTMFSCTKVLYTHEQVMNRYQTKQEVIDKFGIPTEKKTDEDNTEEWLYKFEMKGAFTDHSPAEQLNSKTVAVTEFSRYKRYIIFTIDKQDHVIMSKFDGVNLEERVKNPGGTIALVAGGVALVALMVVAVSNITFSVGNVWGSGH